MAEPMKIWLLTRIDKDAVRHGLDEAHGFVVRSRSAESARAYVADECGDEGRDVWANPKNSTCVELSKVGKPGIILRDFNAA